MDLITTFTCIECGKVYDIETELCGHWKHDDVCITCCGEDD